MPAKPRGTTDLFDELVAQAEGLKEKERSYLRLRWADQVKYYEANASRSRRMHLFLRGTMITCSALGNPNIVPVKFAPVITAVVGILVALSGAWEAFLLPRDKWIHFRMQAETLKSEGFCFAWLTGPYAAFSQHEDALKLFAERTERDLSEERSLYKALADRTSDPSKAPPKP